MTLTQTIVAPWGIWQSVDYRLTDPRTGGTFEKWSQKSVLVRCCDGGALITYAGVGRFDFDPDSPDISDWIAHQLHGHSGTVDKAVRRIEQVSSSLTKFRTHHTFTIGAITQGQIWALIIANTHPDIDWTKHPPGNAFKLYGMQVIDEPIVMVRGEARAIAESDWVLLETVAKRRPKRSRDFLALLAGVNKRAAQNRRYGHVISEECTVSFMPPNVDGGFARTFPEDREIPWSMLGVPQVMFGLDFTQMARDGIRQLEDEVARNKERTGQT
jgi:hypothetical protein